MDVLRNLCVSMYDSFIHSMSITYVFITYSAISESPIEGLDTTRKILTHNFICNFHFKIVYINNNIVFLFNVQFIDQFTPSKFLCCFIPHKIYPPWPVFIHHKVYKC